MRCVEETPQLLEAAPAPGSHLVACHFRGAGAVGEDAIAALPADWSEGSGGLGPFVDPAVAADPASSRPPGATGG
jgi:hypothetical protein